MDASDNQIDSQNDSQKKSITLIALDWKNYERRRSFMHSRASLGTQGWTARIEFADRRFTDAPVSGKQIVDIIESSNTDLVAIIDEEFDCDPRFFAWLADFEDSSKVHCAFQRMRAAKQGTNFFLVVYSFLVRILLRIGKHDFRPGAVVFCRNQNPSDWISQSRDFSTTELVSLARVDGHEIRETLISPRSQPRTPIHSKAVIAESQRLLRFWWNEIMFPGENLIGVQEPSENIESGKTENRPGKLSRTQRGLAWLVLGIVTVIVLSLNLGFPLFEPDETRNAQLALNILQTGEWNTLTLADEPYWDKPPLAAWSIAASFQQFGISEFAARLPGNIAAIFTVFMVCALGRRLVGFRAALTGAFLMLMSIGFVFSGRFITTDSILALWSTIGLLAGYHAIFKSNSSMKWWLVAGAACGAGIMTKGPIILVLCLPPLLLAGWLAGNREILKTRNWFWFGIPIVLIAGPWFAAMVWVHPEFLYHFLWKHHVLRYADSFNHQQPFWYYLPAILIGMFPASCLLPALFRQATVRDRVTRSLRSPEVGFLIICATWVIGFFSLSQSKLPTYILPAYPFICLLFGWMLDSTIFSGSSERLSLSWLKRAPRQVGLLLVAATITLQVLLVLYFKENQAFLFYSIVVPISLLVVAYMTCRRQAPPMTAWVGLAMIAITFTIFTVDRIAPAVSVLRSTHRAVTVLNKSLQTESDFKDAKVIFFGRENYGATIQMDNRNLISFEASKINDMCEYLFRHPNAIVVSSDKAIKNLRVALDPSILLEPHPQYRHLYTSRLGNVRTARRVQQEKRDNRKKR